MTGCLDCDGPLRLVVCLEGRGVPHHLPEHEVVHDWVRIYACAACEAGDLRSFSHDCWAYHEDEPWDMEWSTRIRAGSMQLLRSGFSECPDPTREDCTCAAHRIMRERRSGPAHTEILASRRGFVGVERPTVDVVLTSDRLPTLEPVAT